MVDRVGIQGLDQTQVIGDLGKVTEDFRDSRSALAMSGKLEYGSSDGKRRLPRCHPGESLSIEDGLGNFLAMVLVELRFVVEEIELWRTARLEQINDPLCLRSIMGSGKGARMAPVGAKERTQSKGTESPCRLGKESAARPTRCSMVLIE
tara:strand:- start:71 stop:520 length:450 start_codon:yes stop_codon:yes gene_type:complete